MIKSIVTMQKLFDFFNTGENFLRSRKKKTEQKNE